MAKSVINTGSVANDGTGDTLRAAGVKINDNFSEIYQALGTGSAITLTASVAELNILDGATLSTTELNYVDGVTSSIQTQLNAKAVAADLADVATSGDYADLTNTPTLADVATSGDYADLTGTPTIPTASSLSVDDLITLSGVAEGSANLGTFTGSTVSDNQTVKQAIQALETAVEGKQASITTVLALTASTSAPTVSAGTFAVADGTSWDPATKAGSVPYPVFYDGTSWNALY
jgi:hypothetical protein